MPSSPQPPTPSGRAAGAPADPRRPSEEALALVAAALERIRFGDIRLTLHEGRPVQIDITERTRLPQG